MYVPNEESLKVDYLNQLAMAGYTLMGSYLSVRRTAEKFRMCQSNAALLVFRALVALKYSYTSCDCVRDIGHIVEAMPLRDLVSRVRCFPIICRALSCGSDIE